MVGSFYYAVHLTPSLQKNLGGLGKSQVLTLLKNKVWFRKKSLAKKVIMSMILSCLSCGDIIGTTECFSHNGYTRDIACPGRGKHPPPKRTVVTRRFGLIREVSLFYPESSAHSSWAEYSGPRSKLLLWLAIHFNGREHEGVVVNGKWAWWSFRLGFYGAGVKELKKMGTKRAL